MSRHSRGAVRGPYFNLAGRRSAEDSWTCCHTKTIASFCPHFHPSDCFLLPQNWLCPDSINQRCSSPHHISKPLGLHFDIYSSGNSIAVPHIQSTCNRLCSALKTKHKALLYYLAPSGEDTYSGKSVINYISLKEEYYIGW